MFKRHQFKAGDRVRFARRFLRSTHQYTGPDAPCDFGPFARGTVTRIEPVYKDVNMVIIKWDNGMPGKALNGNLEPEGAPCYD